MSGGLASALSSPAAGDDDLDVKIGSMLMSHFAGTTVSAEVATLVREHFLGGVLLLESNFSSAPSPKASLAKLVKDLQHLSANVLLIAMDQEGGAVNRLKTKYGFPATYSAQHLGERNDLQETRKAADTIATTLSEIGINHNFAPVVDLYINPDNPVVGRNKRCFSADPERVAVHAAEFIRAHREHNIITTLKHFPGHGSSSNDSHQGLTEVTTSWSEDELIPYKRLIDAGLVDSIMTAHIFNSFLDNMYPASLSYEIITKTLRRKLGFQGVVISDDLLMSAITNQFTLEESLNLAINAGNDILLFTTISNGLIPRITSIIKRQVDNGDIALQRINESYARIQKLKENL